MRIQGLADAASSFSGSWIQLKSAPFVLLEARLGVLVSTTTFAVTTRNVLA